MTKSCPLPRNRSTRTVWLPSWICKVALPTTNFLEYFKVIPFITWPLLSTHADKFNLDIAKYFGQSTGDGIQFQFRGIKKDAEMLRKVDRDGGDVANCLPLGGGSSAPVTPSKIMSAKKGGSRSGTTSKRSRINTFIKSAPSDEDDDDEVEDWQDQDQTPSKRAKVTPRSRKAGTPSRLAAMRADATIAESFTQLQSSESPDEMPTPSASAPTAFAPPPSIFGEVERKAIVNHNHIPAVFNNSAFNGMGADAYIGGNLNESFDNSFTYSSFGMGDMGNEGEI